MLNKHNLAIATLAPKEESRYTLNGIQVTPRETVVTDGHRLVRVTTPTADAAQFPVTDTFHAGDDFQPFILPAETAREIVKAIPRKSYHPILENVAIDSSESNKNGHAVMAITDLEQWKRFEPKKLSGEFPAWQQCVPTKKATLTITFNAALLANLLAIAAKSCDNTGRGNAPVTLRFYGSDSPMRIDAVTTAQQQWTAVVMPMRSDTAEVPAAELNAKPAKAKPAKAEKPKTITQLAAETVRVA